MRLLLIRHGQTPSNVAGRLDTAFPGPGLTPLGQAQAAALPAALRAENVTAVYASPLVRTQLTAAPLAAARDLEVQVVPGFEEVSAGELELRADSDAVHAYIGCLVGWMQGDLDRAMPGDADGQAFVARFDAAVRRVAAQHGPGDTVAVVSHGAAIRVWTGLRAVGLGAEAAGEREIRNTGMAALEGDPAAGWRLASWSSEPLGGVELEDVAAHDVTGERVDEAVAED